MEEYVKKLRAQLEAELNKIDPEGDAVRGFDKRADLVRSYLEMLASYVRENPFPDKAAEIHYFRYIAPAFYRDYYFYRKLYWLEVVKITSDAEMYKLFLLAELEICRIYLQRRQRLHRYFYSLRNDLDEELFTRKKPANKRSKLSADKGSYSCAATRRLGLIFTSVQYREYCQKELGEIDSQTGGKRRSSVKCNLSKTEAAEFVSIAYEMKLLSSNGTPYTQTQIKEWVEEQWNIDLKDFKNIDKNSRDKKGPLPSLIKKMLTAYNVRKDRLEEELFKKR